MDFEKLLFVKNSFTLNHSLPLLYPSQLGGKTLIGTDPFFILYPLNVLFTLLPFNIALFSYYLFHLLVLMLSTRLIIGKELKSKQISFYAFIFLSLVVVFVVTEGNLKTLTSFSLVPLAFYLTKQVAITKSFNFAVLASAVLTTILLCSPNIFLFLSFLLLIYLITKSRTGSLKQVLVGGLLILGFSAIFLAPKLVLLISPSYNFMYSGLYKESGLLLRDNSNARIVKQTPNEIVLQSIKNSGERAVILSNLYVLGWYSYQNGRKHKLQNYNGFTKIEIMPNTNRVVLKFEPKSFRIGKLITFSTILFLALVFWYKKKTNIWQK